MSDLHRAYIALGANLGQPHQQLLWAIEQLRLLGHVAAVSSLYQTAPVGGPAGQPDYVNGVLELHTVLDPAPLLTQLHHIEAQAGRERIVHWGARTLDLDLILYDEVVSNDAALLLPHPRAWERLFVLQPLAEIAPDVRHPLLGLTAAEGLALLQGKDA